MRVLIADTMPEASVSDLERYGLTVNYLPDLTGDNLTETLGKSQPEIMIVRSTRVTREMIESDRALSLIIRAGAGFNTIDVEAAAGRSVYVANCPGKNAVAVAELTMGLILGLDRSIPDNVATARSGEWNKSGFSKARGLLGRRLGIVGLGTIGREVALRATAFGMRVSAWSRSLTDDEAGRLGIVRHTDPIALASDSDFVTVHLASTPETRNLISTDFFSAMMPGAGFVNTSRAEVVDEAALIEAVTSRGIRAALDVCEDEPAAKSGAFLSPLCELPGVYLTHHIGASTEQAQLSVAAEAVSIAGTFYTTGSVRNCVNLHTSHAAKSLLSVHHRNRVGVLAAVLDVIRDCGVNVETMENVIFAGGDGACANIRLDDSLSSDTLKRIESLSQNILSVSSLDLS